MCYDLATFCARIMSFAYDYGIIMLKGIALSALMLFCGYVSAECVLKPENVVDRKFVGTFTIDRVSVSGIQFAKKHGDISKDSAFNLDTLYEVSGSNGGFRIRFAEKYFRDGAAYLGNAQWESGIVPKNPGDYRIYALSTKHKEAGATVTMVGDSITWWSAGKNFRCLLSKRMQGVSFVGPHTDAFGYGHAGEGGNKTVDVINRIDKISPSDYYIMHIGTNDWPIGDASFSFENIKAISNSLSRKGGKVLILTILPRLDEHDSRNKEINKMLRDWKGRGCNCVVVDFEDDFRSIPNPKSLYWDKGLHPNLHGYKLLSDIIAPRISAEIPEATDLSISSADTRQ